jgi:hypothetical protein
MSGSLEVLLFTSGSYRLGKSIDTIVVRSNTVQLIPHEHQMRLNPYYWIERHESRGGVARESYYLTKVGGN